jgi:hypothetical protein
VPPSKYIISFSEPAGCFVAEGNFTCSSVCTGVLRYEFFWSASFLSDFWLVQDIITDSITNCMMTILFIKKNRKGKNGCFYDLIKIKTAID